MKTVILKQFIGFLLIIKKTKMKTASLFIICLLAASTLAAVDIDDIAKLNLISMDSADAFDDVLTLLEQLEGQSRGELE